MKGFSLFIFIIALLATIFYSFYEGWYSYLLLWILTFVGTNYYLKLKFHSDRRNVQLLFITSFSLYSLYMNITNFLFVEDPSTEFFMIVDSFKFWNYSNFRMYSIKDFISYYNEILPYTNRYPIFSFINLSLSFYSQLIDENNILVLKLQSVWIGAFSIPFIYSILKKYLLRNKAFNYALVYLLFSHVVIYSVVFNRDPYIYLLFVIGFYLVCNYKMTKSIFLKLTILMILTCGFRLEHGLFFSVFFIAALYLKSLNQPRYKILLFVLFPISILSVFPLIFNSYDSNTDAYQQQIERVERDGFSTGAFLSKLPPGIKQLTMGINSQIAPAVPFWREWTPPASSETYARFPVAGYFTPWRFMESVAAIFWLYVWGVLITAFISKFKNKMTIELKILVIIAFILILAASSSINVRRIYCVYPIIFTVAASLYDKFNSKARYLVFRNTTLFILFLYVLYFYLKI